MHREDLLSGVRIRARLHGRREASRVVRAVLAGLATVVPPVGFRDLVRQLPPEVADGPLPPATPGAGLVGTVARTLRVDQPEAAFLTRQVLAQLNTWCRDVTPATLAPDLPPALYPLLTARPDDPAPRYARHLAVLSAGLPLLSPPVVAAPRPATEPAPVVSRRVNPVRSRAADASTT